MHILVLRSTLDVDEMLVPFLTYDDAYAVYRELPEKDHLHREQTQQFSEVHSISQMSLDQLLDIKQALFGDMYDYLTHDETVKLIREIDDTIDRLVYIKDLLNKTT